jgi:hypothetical protein
MMIERIYFSSVSAEAFEWPEPATPMRLTERDSGMNLLKPNSLVRPEYFLENAARLQEF